MTRPKLLSVTRLPLEAQALIINHIVGGDDDDQIRRALHDAGHTVDLTRPTLRHYRRLPEVVRQIEGMADEAVQSGFGPAVRRGSTGEVSHGTRLECHSRRTHH